MLCQIPQNPSGKHSIVEAAFRNTKPPTPDRNYKEIGRRRATAWLAGWGSSQDAQRLRQGSPLQFLGLPGQSNIPLGYIMVPFGGLYLGSYKVTPYNFWASLDNFSQSRVALCSLATRTHSLVWSKGYGKGCDDPGPLQKIAYHTLTLNPKPQTGPKGQLFQNIGNKEHSRDASETPNEQPCELQMATTESGIPIGP